MDREMFKVLDVDMRISKLNKNFKLSDRFIWLHDNFVKNNKSEDYFVLNSNIKVERKDQLLLNIQYNNLLYGYGVYNYDVYYKYAEEFFTYFLNYEIITNRCNPEFPTIIKNIFEILNKYSV